MFIGELLCLFLYAIKKMMYKDTSSDSSSENKGSVPFLLAIPSIFDIISTCLMFVALTSVAGSVFQMMRGFIVVITAFMAMLFLGRKQYIHHWVSLFVIVSGVAIVGYVSIS